MEKKNNFNYEDLPVELVSDKQSYEGLRDLWCLVFGDEPDFVDHLYKSFGCTPDELSCPGNIMGFVIRSEASTVISALTCYRCGTYLGKDVYVSYAVCTDPEYRGCGLAGRLTSYVRNIVTADPGVSFLMESGDIISGKGGLSIVSPASSDLIGFYKGLGYQPFFFSGQGFTCAEDNEDEWDPGDVGVAPGCTLTRINASMFNQYRESFLAGVPHIALSDEMTEFVRSIGPDGEGLFLINKGDAICALETSEQEDELLHAYAELLVNPQLRELSSEIEEELASSLAEALGADKLFYRMPGDAYCQSMISGELPADEDSGKEAYSGGGAPYFGFPID